MGVFANCAKSHFYGCIFNKEGGITIPRDDFKMGRMTDDTLAATLVFGTMCKSEQIQSELIN